MEGNGSNGSGEGGNTISPSPQRIIPSLRWCFTLNNWTEEQYGSMVPCFQQECRYAIVGKEVGECGTPHLQGYVEFKRKLRPLSLDLPKQIHWEKAKGNREQNTNYCIKDGDVCLTIGVPKPVKTIKECDLYDWQQKIVDEVQLEPDDRTIHWLWSEKGGIGKTTFQKYLCVKHDAIMLGGKAADCRNGVLDYTKKRGHTPNLICVDIPRSFSADYVNYEGFENIKNMLFYSGKYEGGMVCGNPPHLYIFANFEPDVDKMSEDRWDVIKLD